MSRINLIEQIMGKNKRKPATEFDYDSLACPSIAMLFTPADISELASIATSLKYSADIKTKYDLIDKIMRRRGFVKAHAGTNRVVYNFLEDPGFVAKVAIDKVGMTDSPREYVNQQYFKPFCCKIFEVDPTGVLALVERVNPISSLEEFLSIADDAFNLMVTRIIGRYVVDDLGTKTYMNFGIRYNSNGTTFGPVIIDFPYVYELDGAKLICRREMINPITGKHETCGGEIDYKPGFNGLYCTKCNKEYTALDLAKSTKNVEFHYDSENKQLIHDIIHCFRARIMDNGKVIKDSGRQSTRYLSQEEYENMFTEELPAGEYIVDETVYRKRKPLSLTRQNYYNSLQQQYYREFTGRNANPTIGDLIEDGPYTEEPVDLTVNGQIDHNTHYLYGIPNTSAQYQHMPEEIEVDETVDQYGNPVSLDLMLIDELEEATFPELHFDSDPIQDEEQEVDQENIEETSEVVIDMDNPDGMELVPAGEHAVTVKENVDPNDWIDPSSLAVTPAKPITGQAISDEQVQKMVEYVAHKNDEKEELTGDEGIIDSEQDKAMPEISPMTRPYAKADDTISVDAKTQPNLEVVELNSEMPNLLGPTLNEEDEVPLNDALFESEPIPTINDLFEDDQEQAPNEWIQQSEETENIFEDERPRKRKHKKDRGGYDDDEY